MADLRISQVLPTVKCSNCNQPVHVRALADHVCSAIPPMPITIDTSPATVRPRKGSNKSPDSGSPSSASKFSFQFWSGKAKETFKNATLSKKPSVDHAITTTSPIDTTYPHNPFFSNEKRVEDDYEFRPPFAQRQRQNSTSPAPPRLLNKQPSSPSRSTSSDESPISPFDTYPPPRQSCPRCRREIAKDHPAVRTDRNEFYHTQCFTCFVCRTRLDPLQPPFTFDGRIYCKADYKNMVMKQPICAKCQQPIAPHVRPTRALGQFYHPEHIRCHHCNKPVDPEMTGLVERKGKIFCRPDFNMLYLPKCRGCGRAVEKEAVSSADGKLKGKWHKHCFRCHACDAPFPNNTFYVFDNAPYCRRDYHRMNGSLCRACDEPVEGRCAQTSEGWRYHPQCFTCYICRCLITDTYYLSDNKIYCPQDKVFRSEKRRTFFQKI